MIELEDQAAQEDVWAEAAPADARKNVKKKKQIKVSKDGKMGDIAHYHHKENEFEEWEEPCPFVEFRVIAPGGIQINQRLYAGKVVVPQCTADYLAWQQSEKLRAEANIHRSNNINRVVASL